MWVGEDQDFSLLELQPSLRVQDDVSGFASGSIRWSVDGGAYASVTFSGANPSSGNANLGTFLAIEGSSISRYSNEQEAILTYIYLIDNDGNSSITTMPNLRTWVNLEEPACLKIKNSPPGHLAGQTKHYREPAR